MGFLELRGIEKRFGATVALAGVDLDVQEGEVLALVGENGSGKSTLMRILAGAMPADVGTMSLDGKPYAPRNPMQGRQAGVAMIHQELSLCGHLSVAENVLLGMEPTSAGIVKSSEVRERARDALTKLGYPDLDLDAPVQRMPIAIRQVVEIARAVAVGCRVVVLDEPTSSLTEADASKLFDVVDTLRDQGHAIVYISHFLDEVFRLATRVTVLRDGSNVATYPIGEIDSAGIVEAMVGRHIEDMYPRSPRTPGEPILELSKLKGAVKPTDASLTLHRGEVLGIAGLNGAGRTELLRAIFGLDPIVNGEVRLGVYRGEASPHKRWSQGAGMLSEDRKSEGLALTMTIADNMTLTALERFGNTLAIAPKAQSKEAEVWISKMAIRCRGPEQPVGDLSGGNQQKVAIARLLFHGADVMLLDEPTRGIDVASKEQIYRLIDELACQNRAVLVVSSYLPELMGICDRIAVMHKGVVNPAHPISEVTAESLIQEAIGV